LMLGGILTGLLSGLFGVGGGFLIVPMLMVVIELGIHRAVAASLMIIAIIGLTGSFSALWQGEVVWIILLPFIAGSILGMLLGRLIAARIAGLVLQRAFATGILLTGAGMLLHTFMSI
ncbi:MAG: sulfite exporter TauE/SafE family protein, partial [Gammaproteobacteria bacterium]